MTRSRKHKHTADSDGTQHQRQNEQDPSSSTSEELSYAPPPGPPPQETSTEAADTVEFHPQATQASFLRLVSSSSQRDAAGPDPAGKPTVHFVDMCDSLESPSTSEAETPLSQHATPGPDFPHWDGSQADTLQQTLPRITVHASGVSDLPTSDLQQSFTISAGPRAQKLYYLWSPKHQQPDAATASKSYMDSFDDGKKKLLKQGSSPFADVTKQQVARMATWVPNPTDDKHLRKHMPWWVRLLTPKHKLAKGDAEASGGDDSSADPDDKAAMPSWHWKLVVFLCCLVAMICYVDRAAMSVAIIPMSLQYGWSNSLKGAINRCVSLQHMRVGCLKLCWSLMLSGTYYNAAVRNNMPSPLPAILQLHTQLQAKQLLCTRHQQHGIQQYCSNSSTVISGSCFHDSASTQPPW